MDLAMGKLMEFIFYIKEIINHISENATWLFTEHEANNHEALRIKKVKLRRYGFTGSFGIFEG